jgi:hypothetical protein
VALALVGFSDIKLPFQGSQSYGSMVAMGTRSSGNAELEKLLLQKEARIEELEAELQKEKTANDNTAPPDNTANELRASLQQLSSESKKLIAEKDSRISELERQVQSLQNNRSSNTSGADAAALNKLRNDVQRLEARNALLEKLNSDLKKNNEYLSTKIKEQE